MYSYTVYLLESPNPAAAMQSVRREDTTASTNFQWSVTGAITDESVDLAQSTLLRFRRLHENGQRITDTSDKVNNLVQVASLASLQPVAAAILVF